MEPKRRRGALGMKDAGCIETQIWWTLDEWEIVHAAAVADHRPLSQFTRLATLAAAKRFLERNEK